MASWQSITRMQLLIMCMPRLQELDLASAPLVQLQNAYPNAYIVLSGSITVDFPEEIKLPLLPNQYQSISLWGATVTMKYQPIEGALSLLKDQYAVGTVTTKIIQPILFNNQ